MRALVYTDKLQYFTDYPVPDPSPGEALIRILMAGICDTDLEIIQGYMGFRGILGHEFTGRVAKVNHPSQKGLIGKRVVGEINCGCGSCVWCAQGMDRHCPARSVLGIMGRDGCFSDYITLPVKNLKLVPERLRDEEAVFCEPLAAAYEITEQIHIQPAENILVLGDGRLGILTALVLSRTGAHVTLGGHHPEKMKRMSKHPVAVELSEDISERFDVVVEATGSPAGRKQALALVRPKGRVILKSTVAQPANWDVNSAVINEITLIGSRCGPFEPALRALGHLVKVNPLISGIYPLDEGIDALRKAGERESLKILLDMRGES